MYWETMPVWVSIVHLLFNAAIIGTAIYCLIRFQKINLSIFTLVVLIIVQMVGLLNSIGREKGVNEWEHLVNQLVQGELWSLFVVIGYFYLCVWLVLFFSNKKFLIKK
jgi:ribose/xylose/arabinose/galactoside ABC-type transport system permease subunit